MIPQTEIRGNYARVPPIYNTSTCDTLQTQTTGSNLVLQSNASSKRGRRSNVPPEIREQTRRVSLRSIVFAIIKDIYFRFCSIDLSESISLFCILTY
ncbi:unnamed protein product [Schistosoma margrebowiei]|uniref:Uncharacterized protein n=1 Tax=Schistosoma margrebowiei TaxID=48269 RepID=A0A183M157_9TREM|nr:unnamed protein product [Schistosoma margrebowiei]